MIKVLGLVLILFSTISFAGAEEELIALANACNRQEPSALVPVRTDNALLPAGGPGTLAPIETKKWGLDVHRNRQGFDGTGRFVMGDLYSNEDHSAFSRPVIWDTQTGKSVDVESFFPDSRGTVTPYGISPDGKMVYVQVGNGLTQSHVQFVRLDPETGTKTVVAEGYNYPHAEVSPDRKQILFISDAYMRSGETSATLVDTATGKTRQFRLTLPRGLTAARIYWHVSDDGRLITTDVVDKSQPGEPTISLAWQIPPKPARGRTPGPGKPVQIPGVILAMAGNGSAVLTADEDKGGLVVHQFAAGKKPKKFRLAYSAALAKAIKAKNPSYRVEGAEFSPSGNYVAAVITVQVKNASYRETVHAKGIRSHSSSMIDSLYMVVRWSLHPPGEAKVSAIPEPSSITFGRSEPVMKIQDDGSFKVVGASDSNIYLLDSQRGFARIPRPPAHSISEALIGVGLSDDGQKVILNDHTGVQILPLLPGPKAQGPRLALPSAPLLALPAPREDSPPGTGG